MNAEARYARHCRYWLCVVVVMHWLAVGIILWGQLQSGTRDAAFPDECRQIMKSQYAAIDGRACKPARSAENILEPSPQLTVRGAGKSAAKPPQASARQQESRRL